MFKDFGRSCEVTKSVDHLPVLYYCLFTLGNIFTSIEDVPQHVKLQDITTFCCLKGNGPELYLLQTLNRILGSPFFIAATPTKISNEENSEDVKIATARFIEC